MTKKERKLLKKYGYDLNYDYSAILEDKKDDNIEKNKG